MRGGNSMHRIPGKKNPRYAITLEITDDSERAYIQVTLFNSNVSIILNKHFLLLHTTVVRKLDELFPEVKGLLLFWINGQT
jgi:hypothetical protein